MTWEEWTAWHLAEIFIATDWTPRSMEAAALRTIGATRPRKWVTRLIADILETSPTAYAPSPRTVERLILASRAFRGLRLNRREKPLFEQYVLPAPVFAPTPAFQNSSVPELANATDLAHWLNLPLRHLDWFADIEGYRAAAAAETTRHYVYSWIPKRTGPPRLIEAPKLLLKGLQRKILREILDPVAVHDCAHGFRRGRSCIVAATVPSEL